MPSDEEIEEAAKLGYAAAIAHHCVTEESQREHAWERQTEDARDCWREAARYMLARVAADRNRLLAALKELSEGVKADSPEMWGRVATALDGR